MKIFSAIVISLVCVVCAFSQKPANSGYKILFDDSHLTVKYQKKHSRLALGDAIDAAKITETELIFADKKGGFTYLVVAVSGQSKSVQDDRQCGAGMESNLIWIKLDSRLKVSKFKSERYESCWSSITSENGFAVKGKTLKISIDNFRDDTVTELYYDAAKPEKGFQSETVKTARPN